MLKLKFSATCFDPTVSSTGDAFIGRNFNCTVSPLPCGLLSTHHTLLRVCGLSMLLGVSHSFYCVRALC
jgi:hypothetical protein